MVTSNRKSPQKHDKDLKASFSTILLTSGVFIALVTGAFNFFSNLAQERWQVDRQINANRWERLYSAHLKLVDVISQPLIPDEDIPEVFQHGINNKFIITAKQRAVSIISEFLRIRPLLNDQLHKRIDDLVEKEKRLEKELIALQTPDIPYQTQLDKFWELSSLREEMGQTLIETITRQMQALRKLNG